MQLCQCEVDVPWLSFMLSKLGVRETPGPASTKDILEFHAVTAAGVPANGDETHWCGSFQCWGLHKAGLPHPRSKSARSFERYGLELERPRRGAITVLSRGFDPKDGHVGTLVHWDSDWVWLVGGNQGNSVSVARYPRRRVVAYRWPDLHLQEAA